jgi:hypothetical protein
MPNLQSKERRRSMLISEIIQKVVDEKTALLIREKEEMHLEKGAPFKYDVKYFDDTNEGWIIMDLFTASAMLTVYKAISDQHKQKYDCLNLYRLLDFTWRNVK